MRRIWISLVAAALLTIAAIAPAAAQEDSISIDLEEIEGSGVSGTAELVEENGTTMVTLNLEGTPEDGDHPAHIHEGTCDDLGDVVFPLENVVDGMSESTVEASLADIMAAQHAINVHLSDEEIGTYVACGDLPMAEADDDEAVTDDDEDDEDAEDVVPATGSSGGIGPEGMILMVGLLGAASLGTGFLVRRRFAQS